MIWSIIKKSRRWVYQPLLDDLRKSGINALNIGQEIMSRLGNRNPCAIVYQV